MFKYQLLDKSEFIYFWLLVTGMPKDKLKSVKEYIIYCITKAYAFEGYTIYSSIYQGTW